MIKHLTSNACLTHWTIVVQSLQFEGLNLIGSRGPTQGKYTKKFSGPGSGVGHDWYKYANSTMPSVSQTRWWSREEFWAYLLPYLKFDEGDQSEWFDEWINERVTTLRKEKKSVGSHMSKLETFFS